MCKIATGVWNLCNKHVGINIVMNFKAKNYFSLDDLNNKQNTIWRGMRMTIVWKLWNHRNNMVFKPGKMDCVKVFTIAQLRCGGWVTNNYPRVTFSYSSACVLWFA